MSPLIADGTVRSVIDPLAQILARLEVRNVLAGQRHRFAGLGIAALPWRPEVQREGAEAPYLDAISSRQGIAHDLEDLFERELDILGGQMFLFRRDDLDELGLRHGPSLFDIEKDRRPQISDPRSAPSAGRQG